MTASVRNSSMYRSWGTLRYSPSKPNSKTSSPSPNWWLILDCEDREIGRYYRSLYWLDHNKGAKLLRPYWPSHVTIVRDEEPPNKEAWRKHSGERVEFTYIPGVRTNRTPDRFRSFWWLDVVCERFEEIRVELGLPRNSDGIYHMTIGCLEDEGNRDIYNNLWDQSPE